jgi:hypothetical protein
MQEKTARFENARNERESNWPIGSRRTKNFVPHATYGKINFNERQIPCTGSNGVD